MVTLLRRIVGWWYLINVFLAVFVIGYATFTVPDFLMLLANSYSLGQGIMMLVGYGVLALAGLFLVYPEFLVFPWSRTFVSTYLFVTSIYHFFFSQMEAFTFGLASIGAIVNLVAGYLLISERGVGG